MLGGYADALALDAVDIGGGNLSGEEGIFGEIFEVAAAEGIAVEVHAGGQQDVSAVFEDFVAHGGGDFADQVRVPGRGEDGADREAGAVVGAVRALADRVDAEAGGAVGYYGLGDAEARDGLGRTGGSGDEDVAGGGHRAGDHAAPAAADHEGGLLLEGHGGEDFVNVVFAEFGLGGAEDRQGQGSECH